MKDPFCQLTRDSGLLLKINFHSPWSRLYHLWRGSFTLGSYQNKGALGPTSVDMNHLSIIYMYHMAPKTPGLSNSNFFALSKKSFHMPYAHSSPSSSAAFIYSIFS